MSSADQDAKPNPFEGRLSRQVDVLFEELTRQPERIHEAVVVGSGYGGAVAALRLAQAGIEPLVLERGDEVLSGEFPDGLGTAMGCVRIEQNGRFSGLPSGLFDLRIGDGLVALVGNAVGGGSQINANLMLRPNAFAFDQQRNGRRAWPANVDLNGLQPFYDRALRELGAEPFTVTPVGTAASGLGRVPILQEPLKRQRLRDLAGRLQALAPSHVTYAFEPVKPELTVSLLTSETVKNFQQAGADELPEGVCVGCGECVAGCNRNAKKTLAHTYLQRATASGARIYAGVSVLDIKHQTDHKGDPFWELHLVGTRDVGSRRRGVKVPEPVLRTRRLVLAAGSLGSTEILLRSVKEGHLTLSGKLGQGLSTNGDGLAAAHLVKEPVNGVGQGAAGWARDFPGVGPTITASIRVKHKNDEFLDVLIQDAAIPRALAGLTHELVTTMSMLTQLDQWQIRPGDIPELARVYDWAAPHPNLLAHLQTLLIMGHDRGAGTLKLDAATGHGVLSYDRTETKRLAKHHAGLLEGIDGAAGIRLDNPLVGLLPERISAIMTGAAMSPSSITVHPLGGCAMADSAEHGVVNAFGAVFQGTSGHSTYPELYVLDGAIIPTSLGVNPALTITALAERALDQIVAGLPSHASQAPLDWPPPPTEVTLTASVNKRTVAAWPRHIPLQLSEVMRTNPGVTARTTPLDESPYFEWRNPGSNEFIRADARLTLHLPMPSLDLFAADPRHVVQLVPTALPSPVLANDRDSASLRIDVERTRSSNQITQLANFQVIGGSVSLLPVRRTGALRLSITMIRTLVTWAMTRGIAEVMRSMVQSLRRLADGQPRTRSSVADESTSESTRQGWLRRHINLVIDTIILAKHASEERAMHYRVELARDDEPPLRKQPYVLSGIKRVGYPARWREMPGLFLRMLSPLLPAAMLRNRITPWRANVWDSYMSLQVELHTASGELLGRGTLKLDMMDTTRMHPPQLGLRGNSPDAMVSLAGYGLWFLRYLLKTRLWDFRAPDYPTCIPEELAQGRKDAPVPRLTDPDVQWPWPEFPELLVKTDEQTLEKIKPDPSITFQVPSSGKSGHASGAAKVTLALTRYKQLHRVEATRNTGYPNTWQCKAMLMLNGFAQTTLGFVPQEHDRSKDDMGLATLFYEMGYDVWLFDYRVSPLLESSKLRCSMDDIAEHDVPMAIDQVLATLRDELTARVHGSSPGEDPLPQDARLQISCFAHCVGAASLVMSLLSGRLRHQKVPALDTGDPPSKLSAMTLSNMQAYLVASSTAQTRLGFGALARDLLNIDYFRLSAAEREPSAFEVVLDRVFGSLPVDPGEECPGEYSRFTPNPAMCTCKRMSGTISRLLRHDRLLPATHEKLPVYFGRANTGVLAHGARCVEHERLVNADGQNVYVTDDNVHRHMGLPVALLHGRHNPLFRAESAERTYDQLARIHPQLAQKRIIRLLIAEDFAHFDCTIGHGQEMRQQILDPLRIFFDDAWTFNCQQAQPTQAVVAPATRLVPPRGGPIIGWTRPHTQPDKSVGVLLRVWIEVNDTQGTLAHWALTRLTLGNQQHIDALWPVQRIPLWSDLSMQPNPCIAIALADVFVPEAVLAQDLPITLTMVSAHDVVVPPNAATAAAREIAARVVAPASAIPMDSQRLTATPETVTTWLANMRDRERDAFHLMSSANPGTTSRMRRSAAQSRDLPSGTLSVTPHALRLSDQEPLAFFTGSCRHPGLIFDRARASFVLNDLAARIQRNETQGRFMLMLGDQIYADATGKLADSPSPVEKVTLAMQQALASDGFRRLSAQLPLYMLMDDHEVDDSWSLDELTFSDAATEEQKQQAARLYDAAMATFATGQWSHSPCNQSALDGFDYSFEANGAGFFCLDTRSHRTRSPEPSKSPEICTPAQFKAVEGWLNTSEYWLHVLSTGSVVAPGELRYAIDEKSGLDAIRAADNWQLAPGQRRQLLRMLAESNASSILLLSGDYHCAALSVICFKKDDAVRKTAYAVVSPGLYSPYPALNMHPSDLRVRLAQDNNAACDELLDLGGGWTVEISTEAWHGLGYAEFKEGAHAQKRWLELTFHLTLIDALQAPRRQQVVRRLPY
jgi:choline dehydrogenase-like flavoprotein